MFHVKRIVIFVLCVSLVFGSAALPTFFGTTLSGLATFAEHGAEVLLPATINPENIPLTKEIAEKINSATGLTVIDVSGVPDGGLIDDYVVASNLYLNTSDGYYYIIVRKYNWLSSLPVIGSRLTPKRAIPAVVPPLGLVYSINGFVGTQFTQLGETFKSFHLQETRTNAINWIGENW